MLIDRRVVSPDEMASALEELRACVRAALAGHPWVQLSADEVLSEFRGSPETFEPPHPSTAPPSGV